MILLMGIPSETPLRLLAEACKKQRIQHTFFNQRNQEEWKVTIDETNIERSSLSNGKKSYSLGKCKGIYLRTMDQTLVPEYAESTLKTETNNMYYRLFRLMDADTDCRVTNPPSVQMSNNSKPYQSLVIRQQGLDIPDMCITNNAEEARNFIAKYKGTIYKSISGTRSVVKQTDAQALENLHKIKYCPVQFQELVTGFNVRVHVIGQRAIATKICSDAVDYRYAHTENKYATLEPFELSDEISEKCIRLAHCLKLPFAGIDLMFTNDGRTICFEVNPSPGYSYYENSTGQPISSALAQYLAFGVN